MKTSRQFRQYLQLLCFQAIDFLVGDIKPYQIALGLIAGMTLAFFPGFTLQWFAILICTLLVRLNTAMAILGFLFARQFLSVADRLFHQVGYFFLSIPGSHPFFAYLQNAMIVPYTQFNNTVVLGSFLLTFLWAPLIYFSVKHFLNRHHWRIEKHIENSGVWGRILRIRFIEAYVEYRNRY